MGCEGSGRGPPGTAGRDGPGYGGLSRAGGAGRGGAGRPAGAVPAGASDWRTGRGRRGWTFDGRRRRTRLHGRRAAAGGGIALPGSAGRPPLLHAQTQRWRNEATWRCCGPAWPAGVVGDSIPISATSASSNSTAGATLIFFRLGHRFRFDRRFGTDRLLVKRRRFDHWHGRPDRLDEPRGAKHGCSGPRRLGFLGRATTFARETRVSRRTCHRWAARRLVGGQGARRIAAPRLPRSCSTRS